MIAMAAWSASPPRTAASMSSKALTLTSVDLDGAERPLVADDRGDDQVADPGRPGELVGAVHVAELAGEVVARGDDPALGHGPAGQALAEPEPRGADRLALLLGQPGVVGRYEHALVRVELVDHRAVGAQQAARLVDDPLEQVARSADGGDPGGDLAQRLLGLGATLDDRARARQLLDQAGVPDGDRGLRREARSGPRRRRRRRRPTWRDTTDSVPSGPASPAQRDGDDRADPGVARRRCAPRRRG